ncbi:MAG: hypothetical protein JWM28_821 [Chitinophagaceae bacterium]|nr:hypothetical protein [Chitinophagaceae bacterium]
MKKQKKNPGVDSKNKLHKQTGNNKNIISETTYSGNSLSTGLLSDQTKIVADQNFHPATANIFPISWEYIS